MNNNLPADNPNFISLSLTFLFLAILWFALAFILGQRFDFGVYFDPASIVVVFATLLPIQWIVTKRCGVNWSEIWFSLGVPLGLIWSLVGSQGVVTNTDYTRIYPATAITLLVVLYGGLVSAVGYFRQSQPSPHMEIHPLPTLHFCILISIIFGIYFWVVSVVSSIAGASSLEAASILIVTMLSAVLLNREISVEVLCQGALFAALLSLIAGLIIWYSNIDYFYDALTFIHSGLIYPLLAYVCLYIFTFTQVKKVQLNTAVFNWHWLEIIAFFIFMLLAPETIRETMKNSQDDISAFEYESQLNERLASYEQRLTAFERTSTR